MMLPGRRALRAVAVATALIAALVPAAPGAGQGSGRSAGALDASIRGRMAMLASDALAGRASASRDSWLAATYIASELRSIGVDPLGDAGGYLQQFEVLRRGRGRGAPPDGGPAGRESSAGPDAPAAASGWNVVGRIQGADPVRGQETIVLSAHLDHIAARDATADVYNGADDNASGVTAVLELATALASGPRPARSMVFAFYDAEELGGDGSTRFLESPPVALESIVLNLNFEMVGRPDLTLPPATLWLTGYERSTLGAALANRGLRIVPDPRPDQKFFERSDNISFARRGIVGHSLSSFGMHADYHRPTDDLARIDFAHMADVIRMATIAVRWLADSSFTPEWREGIEPAPPGRSATDPQ